MFFKAKRWLWTKVTQGMGADRAYAKYLANFKRVQANAADSELRNDLNVKAMTKEEFVKVWQVKKKCKPGCCS